MFNVTENMLKAILTLKGSPETYGAWLTFITELKFVRDDNLSTCVHFVPSPDDVNARSRHDIMRGIVICLDVLSNALEDPLTLLEDIKIVEQQVSTTKSQDAF